MNQKNPSSIPAKLERAYYEAKPLLIIGIAALVLLGTSWGFSTLLISLSIVFYAGALLFWRLEFRGSLKKLWFGGANNPAPKNPTPASDSDSDLKH